MPMRAVASRRSATTCVSAGGITIHGLQSCRARTARLFARKLSASVRGAIPDNTETQSAAYAARPLARAISQKTRSTYELLVVVTAVRVVVRTVDVSVVVDAAAVEGVGVATAATVAGSSGALVTYGCALANPNDPAKTATVVSNPPSFSPHAGTGPDRLRPGPVLAGIGGRVGDLAFICVMDTG